MYGKLLHEICLAKLDKLRPVLVLTREEVRPRLNTVTIAPISSTIKGLSSEVAVGRENGLDHESVVQIDNINTIPVSDIGRTVGFLLPSQEEQLSKAIKYAFSLVAVELF